MEKFITGMHSVGEAMSAAISSQVTKEAQEAQKRQPEVKNLPAVIITKPPGNHPG